MLNNRELKLERKPWITKVIRKTISKRDKLYRKFLKERIQESKEELYNTYKKLTNKIVNSLS